MIRRNQTEKNIFSDKYAFKYRGKQLYEEGSLPQGENGRNQQEVSQDENARLASNNKKYHQYKEERELRMKKNESEAKNESRGSTLPLSEQKVEQRNIEPPSKEPTLLKRDYNYEIQPPLEEKENDTPPNETFNQHAKPSIPRIDKYQKRNREPLNFSYDVQPKTVRSPTQKRVSCQSIRKYQIKPSQRLNTKLCTPHFEQSSSLTERKHDSKNVYSQVEHFSNNYRNRQVKPQQSFRLKINYQDNSNQHKRLESILSREINYFKAPPQLIPTHAQPAPSCSVPAPPQPLDPEQVCQKLHQISLFNSQINERIKNIIGGFLTIKKKL